ncbi:hypothetical protein INS49_015401 [Diaporthe citri]|uniref:uncharacterized protein n=1 Tax=Diaporthe citri TaxID=83186 RepID=UPI001C805A36|nr:uncharacterized protein INS49_015401 [Diaporthe citri]KAG6356016.1 hypothetical protein INS49_015401 [Diaporthe citri]
MAPYVDLRDDKLFPSWRNLPIATDTHSCFLAEIQECDGFLRYRTIVRDHEGAESVVAFYPDSYDDGFDFKQLRSGRTLAIMNALPHHFLDGTHGVRVEDMDDVCVFPIGLQALRELSHDVVKYAVDSESKQWKCQGCETSKPTGQMSRCGECKVYSYCSKECQAKGWTDKKHKSTCKVMRGPNFLSLLKFDFSSGPDSNPLTFQRR